MKIEVTSVRRRGGKENEGVQYNSKIKKENKITWGWFKLLARLLPAPTLPKFSNTSKHEPFLLKLQQKKTTVN